MKKLTISSLLRVASRSSAFAIAVGAWLAGSTALAAPANDNFADAIDLTGVAAGQTGNVTAGTQTGTNTTDATLETLEPKRATYDDGSFSEFNNTVWFKWTCPEDGTLRLKTVGSTNTATPAPGEWDAVVGVFSGTAVDALTPLGTSPQDTGVPETLTVPVTAGVTYRIQLAGYVSEAASNILLDWNFVRTIYEAKILTMGPGTAFIADVFENAATIDLSVLYGTDLATLAPTFTLSPGATCNRVSGVTPSPNFGAGSVTYTITAAGLSPTVNTYTVTATVAAPSIECDIISFGANVAESSAQIVSTDVDKGVIIWTVPIGTDVASLAPSYTLSPGATCPQPNPGIPTPAFSTVTPVPYVVTAQAANTKNYSVIVRVATPPPVTGGLRLWLDASQLTGLTDGQQVDTWTDKSGLSGNDALRTAGSPKFKTNVLYGKPVIRFDNASSFTTANLSSQFPTAATVFVMTTLNNDTGYALVSTNPTADEWWRWDGNGRSYSALFRSSRLESYCPMPSSGTHLFSVTSAASAWQMWIDGSNQGVSAGSYSAGGVHVIGNNNRNRYLNGDIAEVIEYDRVLTEAERVSVETYLTNKWLPVPTAATITAFGPGAVIGPLFGNAADITWTVPYGTNVAALPATFTMSYGATCNKISGATQDFTAPVLYEVKSLDTQTTNIYTVYVEVTPISSESNILSFGPNAVISGNDITWYAPGGSVLSALTPTYTVSPFATGSPASGAAVDFTTSPQTYTITAQDGTTQEYYVTASVVPTESTVLWNLTGNGNWNFSTLNWLGQTSNLPTPFFNGYNVIFGKTNGGTVTIAPGMSPLSTTVNAASGTYSFTGSPIATGTLTKSGAGTLVLKTPNTYAGGTLISGGTVSIDNLVQDTLGTGTVTMDTGGTMTLSRQNITNAVIIGAGGGKINGGNSFGDNVSGPVTLNGTLTVDSGGTGSHEIDGNISGPGGITKIGTNWGNGSGMVLRGTNTYTGPTRILGSKAQVTKAAALGSGDLIIGNLGGNVTGTQLNLNFTGTKIVSSLTLNGVVQSNPGTYGSVASGANFQNDTLFAGAGTVTLLPAANMLTFGTNVVDGDAVISPVVGNAATITWTVPSGTDLATLAPTFTTSIGATCTQVSGAVPSPNFSTGPVVYSVTSSDSLITNVYTVTVIVTILPDVFTWASASSGNWNDSAKWTNEKVPVIVTAPLPGGRSIYTLNFTPAGTYTATNNLSAGFKLNRLNFSAAATLAGNGLNLVASGATLPTINQNSASTVAISTPLILGANTTVAGTGAGEMQFTATSVISGTGSLTKNSTGQLKIFSVNNSFSGGTIINTGRLHLDLDLLTLGTGSITLNGGEIFLWRARPTNALIVNGGKVIAENGFNNNRFDGPITLNTTLTCDVYYSLTCSNAISGVGGITKTQTGPMILSGTNTYTGPTTVTGGTLQCNAATALGGGALSISTGGAKVNLNYVGTKTVATLTLGGVAQTVPGTYGSVASGASVQSDTYFAGTGTVTVPSATISVFGTNVIGSSAVISSVVANAATIAYTVPFGTNLTTLAPTFTMSVGATCTQSSGVVPSPDFSTGPVVYSVTSADSLITNAYTVTITIGPPSTAKVMSNVFFSGLGYARPTDATATSFLLNVKNGTPVNPLSPTYSMSPLAIGSPASGAPLNFSTSQIYRITSQDALFQDYTVAVAPYTGYAARVMDGIYAAPFAYWPLNEGTGPAAYDNSSGNNGSYSNPGVSYNVAGPAGENAVRFSGTAGVAMEIPRVAALTPDTSFSVEMWVKPAAVPLVTSPQYVASNAKMSSPREGWYLAQDNGGTFLVGQAFVVRMFNRNGTTQACQLYAPIDTVRWYHLVLTYDSVTKIARFYEAGAANETDQYGKATLPSYFGNTTTSPFTIGKRSDNALPWAGSAAHVAFYDRALTAAEVQYHYSAIGGDYDAWASLYAGGQSANLDFNNDGVQNGIAYFMGATGTATNPGLNASNTITWPMSPTFSGTYEIQTSSDLSAWTNVTPRPLPASGNLSYTLPSGLGSRFVRLVATPKP
jgi:autotransporter-associated beta strand protein